MRETDVAIVGGGFAGSVAAAMLGRSGISATLVDPHPVYPPDFRCEKLDASQVALLRKTGLAGDVLPATTRNTEIWVARRGRVTERRRTEQNAGLYHTMVNAARAAIPPGTDVIHAKANAMRTSADRQSIVLSNGEDLSARLIVLANGLNSALRKNMDLTCDILSACHSVGVGFDIRPADGRSFAFPALTYFPEGPADRMAYCTFFPIGSSMRANLFVYRGMDDPWLRAMRKSPDQSLLQVMPKLEAVIGRFQVSSDVKIRPIDLYVTGGIRQPGVVLVGDAFATSCPAAGTGLNKVLTDVERLCGLYIPQWLETGGMPEEKISLFYRDEAKRACDADSLAKAYRLRAYSTETGLYWSTLRRAKRAGQIGVATARELLNRHGDRTQRPHSIATGGPGH